jgi:hypothetical protein
MTSRLGFQVCAVPRYYIPYSFHGVVGFKFGKRMRSELKMPRQLMALLSYRGPEQVEHYSIRIRMYRTAGYGSHTVR